ncbi:hypothetical protein DFR41_104252 [Pseudacidovorax intermedius]|uniref:Uncharacterized protein n=1 Tax=Pseudacidovorax intermedius TaxID=433924 RepID=A0A370FGL8_9BURK|nr:hypothetical protein [Pseudacidovorax intermedius]RDI25195.1 hypothetical protein DFR41_104252 [Pseudacidovorax intermedius]
MPLQAVRVTHVDARNRRRRLHVIAVNVRAAIDQVLALYGDARSLSARRLVGPYDRKHP